MAKQIYIDGNGNEQLVSGTINNAEMLPIESGSATDTKSYIDNAINTLPYNSNITSISSSHASVTVNQGGYIKCGKVVFVTVKITLSSNLNISTKILSGLPTDSTDGTGVLISGMQGTFSARMSNGELYLNQNLNSSEYWVNGCYFTNQ